MLASSVLAYPFGRERERPPREVVAIVFSMHALLPIHKQCTNVKMY